MTSAPIPVFINGLPHSARPGASLAEVLGAADPDLLAALLDGEGRATDARGIAVAPDAPVHAGAIYRVFRSARQGGDADA